MRGDVARALRWVDSHRAGAGAVGALALLGIVIRVIVYRSSIGRLEGDEATWGLMARHFEHGQVSAFFWGQSYGGTIEVFPVAALFAIFGTHLVLMRIVPVAFTAIAAVVVGIVGRRLGGTLSGVAAAAILWIWPIFAVWKTEIWAGFYGAGLLCSALVLLAVLRVDERPDAARVALLGFVLGVSFWESAQTVALFVPALAWLTVRRPSAWKHVWAAVPAAVLGGLPWLLSNLRHDWWSFTIPGGALTYTSRLRGYFDAVLPMILGLRVPFSADWLFWKPLAGAVYAATWVALLAAGWRWRRTPASLLVFVILAYPFVYAADEETWITSDARYAMVLLPALVLVLSRAAASPARAGLVVGVAAALSVAGLVTWIHHADAAAGADAYDVETVDVGPAIAELRRDGLDRAYADYWLAYRMTFDTRERIVVSEADLSSLRATAPGRVLPPVPTNYREHHHPAYDTAVRTAARYAYVFVRGETHQLRDVRLLLRNGFREQRVDTFLILVSPPQPVSQRSTGVAESTP